MKKIFWLIPGIYFSIMTVLVIHWFNGSLIWQSFLLLFAALYCILKSNIITIIWDKYFPDATDWDKEDAELK